MKYTKISELVIGYIVTMDVGKLAHLKLSQIADYFDLNRSYLSKRFKLESKHTILFYIQFEKMKRAETWLKTRFDLSVEAIAALLGITDIRRFRKQFRGIYGMNPGTYRSFFKTAFPPSDSGLPLA